MTSVDSMLLNVNYYEICCFPNNSIEILDDFLEALANFVVGTLDELV
jgi:hypothetical protein